MARGRAPQGAPCSEPTGPTVDTEGGDAEVAVGGAFDGWARPVLPLGSVPSAVGTTSFSVWAPRSGSVRLRLRPGDHGVGAREETLEPTGDGYHGVVLDACPAGVRYHYLLDDGRALADPASRFQPEGVHGPSEVFDPGVHRWTDAGFVAAPLRSAVLYELHVGTFTAAGTLDAAAEHLPALAELGVTAIEPMPIAQFPGRWNWGYDGVFPFAVHDTYGGPAALQRFADACHRCGMSLVLDVVYNHLGPEGDVLEAYGPYLTDRYRTPWGTAVNFDGPGSDDVRRFFVENAVGWFRDFHVDALRLDAVHGIVDTTATPFLVDLARAVEEQRQQTGRSWSLIAESADNDPRVVSSRAAGGLGLDAQWNDDFHHALHALITGERAGYYVDFGGLDQLARAMDQGFVFQGEYSAHRGRRHGAPSGGIEPDRFVIFAQNHDHVGNRPAGDRLASLVSPASLRLAAAVVLLAPGVPLLFMGEEYGETAPFPYFVDHGEAELAAATWAGRAEEMASLGLAGKMLDPRAESTRRVAVLDRSLAASGDHARLRQLYAALIRLRREHPALVGARRSQISAHGAGGVLTLVRISGPSRLVALFNFNLGSATASLPDPPVPSAEVSPIGRWVVVVDSGEPDLGGRGEMATLALATGVVTLAGSGFAAYEWASPRR